MEKETDNQIQKPTEKQAPRPPKGLLKPQTKLDKIALSAVLSNKRIFPVGGNKSPLIQEWQQPEAGSYEKGQLEQWRAKYKNPYWGMPCGPENKVFVTDVDFQKDQETKKPIGPPIMGPVTLEMLKYASFKQCTQSQFQGQSGQHFFWLWENRLNIFSNIRLGGTTIDIRTLRGQVVLYKPLPTPDIWDKLTPMSDKLFEILKSLLKERSQQQAWKDGNRNNTLYKEACLDIERNQGRNIPALIEKAKLVGLPKHEIKETTKSALKKVITGTHGIDPGPSLNDQYPTGANKKAIVTWVTAPKKEPAPEWLWPSLVPYSCLSMWAGLTGKGRTTTLLNVLTFNAIKAKMPGTEQTGDGRPFLYHGPENASNIIKKRVKDAGGNLNTDIFYLQLTKEQTKLPIMQIPKDLLIRETLQAIESEKFSAVVLDTIYLLLKDQNSGVMDTLMPLIQACHNKKTALIGVAHLKKSIADQEIIHHIRGDSDLVTLARSVVYMREGKEKSQRVIVPLKNSLTGDLDTGFVTTMPDNDSPLSFQHYTDNNFQILKDHGKPFNSFNDSPEDNSNKDLIGDILAVFETKGGNGKWKSEDFKIWLKNHTKKKWNRKAEQRLLETAGLIRKPVGTDHYLFKRQEAGGGDNVPCPMSPPPF